jgi:hypothetical protein
MARPKKPPVPPPSLRPPKIQDPELDRQLAEIEKKQLLRLRQAAGGCGQTQTDSDPTHTRQKTSAAIWLTFNRIRPRFKSDRKAVLFMAKTSKCSPRTIWRVVEEGVKKDFPTQKGMLGHWGADFTGSGWVHDPSTWAIGDSPGEKHFVPESPP